jgi:hypothetical protein
MDGQVFTLWSFGSGWQVRLRVADCPAIKRPSSSVSGSAQRSVGVPFERAVSLDLNLDAFVFVHPYPGRKQSGDHNPNSKR